MYVKKSRHKDVLTKKKDLPFKILFKNQRDALLFSIYLQNIFIRWWFPANDRDLLVYFGLGKKIKRLKIEEIDFKFSLSSQGSVPRKIYSSSPLPSLRLKEPKQIFCVVTDSCRQGEIAPSTVYKQMTALYT